MLMMSSSLAPFPSSTTAPTPPTSMWVKNSPVESTGGRQFISQPVAIPASAILRPLCLKSAFSPASPHVSVVQNHLAVSFSGSAFALVRPRKSLPAFYWEPYLCEMEVADKMHCFSRYPYGSYSNRAYYPPYNSVLGCGVKYAVPDLGRASFDSGKEADQSEFPVLSRLLENPEKSERILSSRGDVVLVTDVGDRDPEHRLAKVMKEVRQLELKRRNGAFPTSPGTHSGKKRAQRDRVTKFPAVDKVVVGCIGERSGSGKKISAMATGRSNKGKARYGCTGCDRVFQYPRSLATHTLVHDDVRPHRCNFEGCDKAFRQTGHLQTHRLIHTGEKPFRCPVKGCRTPAFRHANRRCPAHPGHRLEKVIRGDEVTNLSIKSADAFITAPREMEDDGSEEAKAAWALIQISRSSASSPSSV